MRQSLRARLALDFALLTLALVVGGAAGLYHSYAKHCLRDLDDKLSLTLQALALSCLAGEDGPKVTLPEETRLQAMPADGAPLWFIIRDRHDRVLARSSEVVIMPDLPRLPGTAAAPVFEDLVLPDGHPIRVAGAEIIPPRQAGLVRVPDSPQEVHVTAALSRRPLLAYLSEVRRTIGITAALVLLVLTGLAGWIVHRALRPLQALSGEISRFPVGGPSRFSTPRRAAELGPVVDRLNSLMERVGRTLARERGFAMGAAHELRTPLAGLRARLELALSRPRSAEEYRAELREALEIERGLESMVTHLLLLARLGQDGSGSFVTKPIHVGRLLRECWGEFFDRAEQRRLGVSIRVPDRAPDLHSSEDLLSLLIRNLFDNAVSYTPEAGRIDIAAAPSGQGWAITVSNTNPGLRENDLPRLVEPFWRARHEEAAQDGRHAGLGLALCQRIANELGGALVHFLGDNGMVCARVTLPLHSPPRSEHGSGI